MFHKVLRKRVLAVSFSLLLSVFVCSGQSVQKSIKLKSGRPLFSQISEKAKIYEVEDDFDFGKYFEMTIPDSPNNPGQKYYLTEMGKALLSNKE